MSRIKSLTKLEEQMPIFHKSSFDFEKCGINERDKQKVITAESVIVKRFKDYSEATFDICKSLYEVSLVLKADKSFMEWCDHVKLTKDKVSELLKRYELYMELTDDREWVSSLSGQAVKILTHKDTPLELIYEVYENKIKTAEAMKQYIEFSNLANKKCQKLVEDKSVQCIVEPEVEILENPFTLNTTLEEITEAEIVETHKLEAQDEDTYRLETQFKQIKKEITDLKQSKTVIKYKKLIKALKRDLEELEKIVDTAEETQVLENNMRLYEKN